MLHSGCRALPRANGRARWARGAPAAPGAARPLATTTRRHWRGAPAFVAAAVAEQEAGTTRTQRMFDAVDQRQPQAGGAGGRTTYDALLAADAAWRAVRMARPGDAGPAPTFVRETRGPIPDSESLEGEPFDAVVCGGTLGIFVAAALARRGHRVAVVERAELRGRAQEWNISRKELGELRELGLLSEDEEAAAVAIEFNPVRVGFHSGGGGNRSGDVWTRDVLNLGVRPNVLIQAMRRRLEEAGGVVFEGTQLLGMDVHTDGVALTLSGPPAASSNGANGKGSGGGERRIAARLVLDCMGHASPIVRQIRWGERPDGICLVVGGCASGFDPAHNTTADVICTVSDSAPLGAPGAGPGSAVGAPLQLFWEAFPSSDSPDSRTTYMFTYCDAQPFRPGLLELFEEYWRRLPGYQQDAMPPGGLDALQFKRLLFAFFPTYKSSPLRPAFDRVLQIGDASGIQSPLSFGGFGALTRHLRRLEGALDEALSCDALSRDDLALINPYSPGLSAAWMLQRAMTAAPAPGEAAPPGLINNMLGGNFTAMAGLGDAVMRPFLQDVLQFGPLLQTMGSQMTRDPASVPRLVAHIGLGPLLEWTGHVGMLGAYTALGSAAAPLLRERVLPQLTPREAFRLRRRLEAWEYGSGQDYRM